MQIFAFRMVLWILIFGFGSDPDRILLNFCSSGICNRVVVPHFSVVALFSIRYSLNYFTECKIAKYDSDFGPDRVGKFFLDSVKYWI